MPKIPHPPKLAELTITLPRVLDGRPMTPERAEVIAKGLQGRQGRVYLDGRGTPSIEPEQVIEWARAAERAAERARW